MQKITLATAIICTTLVAHLSARGLMPSIDRIKKKIDAALESGIQQSFKELLNGAHNGIITLGKNQETNTPKDLAAAEKQISDLYWANQNNFITELVNTSKQSTDQATHRLKTKIKEKYATAKIPLVLFAQDLAAEELFLQNFTTSLLGLSANKQNASVRLQDLYKKHAQCKDALQQLIGIVNTLLIG